MGRRLVEEDLNALRHSFRAELGSSEWAGTTAYRFSAPDVRLVVWAGSRSATWIASPATAKDHVLLLRRRQRTLGAIGRRR